MNRRAAEVVPLGTRARHAAVTPTFKDMLLFIICARRNIRRTVAILDAQHRAACAYRRQARKLREHATPFDAARLEALDAGAVLLAEACKRTRAGLRAAGGLLLEACPMIDAATTLVQRCEMLGVNVADRAELTEADGVREIIFAHGLEDSAWHRGRAWKSGPMFQSAQEVFTDFLLNTCAGQQLGNSLFQSGGVFAHVPTYKQTPNGTMKRQPPRLHVVPGAPTSGA